MEISKTILGEEHPHTVLSMNNLAAMLQGREKFDEAEPIYRQTLLLLENSFCKEHRSTLAIINNCAGMLESRGKYDEAEDRKSVV